MTAECVFCQIICGKAEAQKFDRIGACVVFEPLNPVVPGHMLVVPVYHVMDAFVSPLTTGVTFQAAAEWAADRYEACNLLTSIGEVATQSVFHLHVHIVPRALGDGLMLPWSRQQEEAAAERGRQELLASARASG